MQLIRGDTGKFYFQRLNNDGSPITEIADKVYFTVKESNKSKDIIIQKTLDDMTFDLNGFYHFTIEPNETDGLRYDTYYFDVQIEAHGIKTTIAYGKFEILPEITFASDEVNKNGTTD